MNKRNSLTKQRPVMNIYEGHSINNGNFDLGETCNVYKSHSISGGGEFFD